ARAHSAILKPHALAETAAPPDAPSSMERRLRQLPPVVPRASSLERTSSLDITAWHSRDDKDSDADRHLSTAPSAAAFRAQSKLIAQSTQAALPTPVQIPSAKSESKKKLVRKPQKPIAGSSSA